MCRECGYSGLVAPSCKQRGFCPSCLGRRMADTAVHLEQSVLPRVGDRVLVGMGSVILGNVEIGADRLIAAGSVVPPRMKVPARTLVRGSPATVIRDVTPDGALLGINGAVSYRELAREHRRQQG